MPTASTSQAISPSAKNLIFSNQLNENAKEAYKSLIANEKSIMKQFETDRLNMSKQSNLDAIEAERLRNIKFPDLIAFQAVSENCAPTIIYAPAFDHSLASKYHHVNHQIHMKPQDVIASKNHSFTIERAITTWRDIFNWFNNSSNINLIWLLFQRVTPNEISALSTTAYNRLPLLNERIKKMTTQQRGEMAKQINQILNVIHFHRICTIEYSEPESISGISLEKKVNCLQVKYKTGYSTNLYGIFNHFFRDAGANTKLLTNFATLLLNSTLSSEAILNECLEYLPPNNIDLVHSLTPEKDLYWLTLSEGINWKDIRSGITKIKMCELLITQHSSATKSYAIPPNTILFPTLLHNEDNNLLQLKHTIISPHLLSMLDAINFPYQRSIEEQFYLFIFHIHRALKLSPTVPESYEDIDSSTNSTSEKGREKKLPPPHWSSKDSKSILPDVASIANYEALKAAIDSCSSINAINTIIHYIDDIIGILRGFKLIRLLAKNNIKIETFYKGGESYISLIENWKNSTDSSFTQIFKDQSVRVTNIKAYIALSTEKLRLTDQKSLLTDRTVVYPAKKTKADYKVRKLTTFIYRPPPPKQLLPSTTSETQVKVGSKRKTLENNAFCNTRNIKYPKIQSDNHKEDTNKLLTCPPLAKVTTDPQTIIPLVSPAPKCSTQAYLVSSVEQALSPHSRSLAKINNESDKKTIIKNDARLTIGNLIPNTYSDNGLAMLELDEEELESDITRHFDQIIPNNTAPFKDIDLEQYIEKDIKISWS